MERLASEQANFYKVMCGLGAVLPAPTPLASHAPALQTTDYYLKIFGSYVTCKLCEFVNLTQSPIFIGSMMIF